MVGGGKALCFLLYMVSHKIRFVRRSCQLCVVIISIPSGPCILYEMERCIQTQQVNGTNTASEWNKYHCIRVTCHISKQNTAENTTIYWVWWLDAPIVDTTAQPTIQRSGELVGVIRPQSKSVHLLWGVAWVGVSSLVHGA